MNSDELRAPASENIERAVLGCLLQDNRLYAEAKVLRAEDFYLPSHWLIFRRIAALIDAGGAADALTVNEDLKSRNEHASIGEGAWAYVVDLDKDLPRRLSIRDYIQILQKKAWLRALQRTGEILYRTAGEVDDPATLWAQAHDRLTELGMEAQSAVPAFSVDAMLEAIRKTPEGLTTGWSSLDSAGIRLRPKELTIVAGRTGHCKSTALLNIFAHLLCREKDFSGKKLLLFSHEEPVELVTCRLIALGSRLVDKFGEYGKWSFENVRRHYSGDRVSGLSFDALESAVEWLRDLESRIEIIWKPDWNSQSICQYVRGAGDAAAVFIDYLQRVPPPDNARKNDRRDMDISATARDFKTLAIEQSVPVIVAAQIGRQSVDGAKMKAVKMLDEPAAIEELRGMRPELHHLREGGSEQEADMVLGLMNYAADISAEASGNDQRPISRRLDIGVLKQRYGPSGTWFTLMHEGLYGRIRDREEHDK